MTDVGGLPSWQHTAALEQELGERGLWVPGHCCCSVAKWYLTLQLHGLQHARLPCPSLSPKFMSIESVMISNHLILCHPLLLPSVFPSIKAFSSESNLCIKGPKYWSFRFSISTANEYSRLISFRIDWFDLLAVQGTLKSLLQQHNLKSSVLQHQPSLWTNSHICVWLLEKL